MPQDFDWNDADDAVVVRPQMETAVYQNAAGEAVIRQRGDDPHNDDVIVLNHQALSAVIEALREIEAQLQAAAGQ